MRHFFQGWKRKAGVVTLIGSLIVFSGWIRSQSVRDSFTFGSGQEQIVDSLDSSRGGIIWRRHWFEREVFYPAGWSSRPHLANELAEYFNDFGPAYQTETRWHFCGFVVGAARTRDPAGYYTAGDEQDNSESDLEDPKDRATYCVIPYWSIVLPLTLISGWLLLSKLRPQKPKSSPEPKPETAA